MADQQEHRHVFGRVAYVAYVDGDRNVHRVDLKRCACGAQTWEETHVDAAVPVVTDSDLKGQADPA